VEKCFTDLQNAHIKVRFLDKNSLVMEN